jgi:hypothetical protein
MADLASTNHMFLGGSPLFQFQIQSTRRSEIVRSTVISQNGTSWLAKTSGLPVWA